MQRPSDELAVLGRFEEAAVLILTSLIPGPRHGYAIIKDVGDVAGVVLRPGTLYAALSRLESLGLVEALAADERRRPYRITGAGMALVRERLDRMKAVAETGLHRLAQA
jgi:DNA-binding PadR family transcriptional regulator